MLDASPGPVNTTIGLLMIGNTLPGLTSLVSNCIGRMHVYEYGDNINNPHWIIHPVCQQESVQSGGASVMGTRWPSGNVSGGLQARNPIPPKIRRTYSLMHVKSYVGSQTSPAGVMRKFGKGVPAQASSPSSDRG
ncbi:hypothetical protein AVEN_148510-1 [Araneus ventricosus]|uniref:Uncharacterized protein n=1 Tax=Araneus ventricosus TaxID=182803 RepID=A0A4Y2JUS8_ARAVE|nr:hypothetical protein AVEN_148510-1 [Araneus ventricosus]